MVWTLVFCAAATTAPNPSAQLSPQQVVEAQLKPLAHNDTPTEDAGIAAAFRFASPENKKVTGPLKKFIGIVRSEAYAPMIDHVRFEVGEPRITGDRAAVPVRLFAANGRKYGYVFLLGRQNDGQYAGCWMTDGVQLFADEPAGVEL
ncbi:MAG: DUF4864 domain-containing protein [Myxococcota bacterium]